MHRETGIVSILYQSRQQRPRLIVVTSINQAGGRPNRGSIACDPSQIRAGGYARLAVQQLHQWQAAAEIMATMS